MLTKQSQSFTLILTTHHAFKHIILTFNLFLLAIFNITTNKKYHSYYDKYKHTEEAGVEHDESYQSTDSESYKCSDKPTTNHRKHTRNTIYSTFTTPGAVGQRATHRYNECNISSRQRQFHGCTDDNQQSGKNQIHRSTYHIKRSSVCQNNLIFIETAVNPTTNIYRNNTYQKIIDISRTTNNHTSQCRRTEHFITFFLTSQIYRSLDYILRFL